jgi:hypothetical protein
MKNVTLHNSTHEWSYNACCDVAPDFNPLGSMV